MMLIAVKMLIQKNVTRVMLMMLMILVAMKMIMNKKETMVMMTM
jgi:hypothetical protein